MIHLPFNALGSNLGLFDDTYTFIIAVVRRLHDRNKSGWWLLIVLIPIIGPFWLFVDCGLLPAKEEGNSY